MTDFALQTSYWFDTSAPSSAPLTRDAQADVAIIGGGYAGLSSALQLKKTAPHLRVSLIESKHAGFGASGRNAGWLSSFPPLYWLIDDLSNPRKQSDFSFATEFCNKNTAAIGQSLLASTSTSSWADTRYHLLARNFFEKAVIYWLKSRIELCGIPCEITEQKGAGPVVNYPYVAVLTWHDTVVNPYALIGHLRQQCLDAGVEIFENSPVKRVTSEPNHLTLHTEQDSKLVAEKVVLATNAYSSQLALDVKLPRIAARHTYVIATEELPPAMIQEVSAAQAPFGDASLSYFCGRFHHNRFLFNGGDRRSHASAIDDAHKPSFDRLYNEMIRRFPVLRSVAIESAWGGPFMVTSTETPLVKPSATNPNFIFNIGYGGGSGIGAALQSGRLVTDLILGDASHDHDARRLREIYAACHFPPLGPVRAVTGVLKNLLLRAVKA